MAEQEKKAAFGKIPFLSRLISERTQGYIIKRKRKNQPTGPGLRNASMHYGKKHNYLYAPIGWYDPKTKKVFRKGFYDENGNWYESVAFRGDTKGDYDNVLCHCRSCKTVMHTDWKNGERIKCPKCNRDMWITSILDEYTKPPKKPLKSK